MALPSPLRPAPRRRPHGRGRVAGLLAALAAGALMLAAGCGGGGSSADTTSTTTAPTTVTTPPRTTTIPTTGNRAIDRYLRDVSQAATALGDFSRILAEAGIGSGLRRRQGDLRAALARFDGAMGSIGRRKLPKVPSIERQRDQINRAGRRLSSSLVRFIDAAARGDVSTVQSLLPDVTGRIDDFQAAVAG
jgi:hypothetical protein